MYMSIKKNIINFSTAVRCIENRHLIHVSHEVSCWRQVFHRYIETMVDDMKPVGNTGSI